MRPVALLVVALFVLAGCNGLPAGTDSPEAAETVTPAPVPATDGSETETPQPDRITRPPGTPLPPGVSVDGSVNLTRLVCANNRYLANRSHTRVRTRQYPANSTMSNTTSRIRIAGDRVLVNYGPPDEERPDAVYVDRTGQYERWVENGTATTEHINDSAWKPTPGIPPFVFGFDTERSPPGVVVETVEREGETLYRIYVPPTSGPTDDYRHTATLYVTPQGVFRSVFLADLPGDDGDTPDRASNPRAQERYTIRAIGETTVEQPAWVGNLKRNATVTNRTDPVGVGPWC